MWSSAAMIYFLTCKLTKHIVIFAMFPEAFYIHKPARLRCQQPPAIQPTNFIWNLRVYRAAPRGWGNYDRTVRKIHLCTFGTPSFLLARQTKGL